MIRTVNRKMIKTNRKTIVETIIANEGKNVEDSSSVDFIFIVVRIVDDDDDDEVKEEFERSDETSVETTRVRG